MAGSEKKKRIIVLASLLKPVDDTRMFEKMAVSLANDPDNEVHVVGFPSGNQPAHPLIIFHPLRAFNRLSLQRLSAAGEVFAKSIKLKPDTFIATTHELLDVGVVLKLLFRTRLIYDVQENYFSNILHGTSLPAFLRYPIAAVVRFGEYLASFFVDKFVLAEACYQDELSFIGKKFIIIPNKARRPLSINSSRPRQAERLVFTGTLAETTGVFEAIELAKKLHAIHAGISLQIIGYAPQKSILNRLKTVIAGSSFITLLGGDQLVAHQEILQAIVSADFGIVSYSPNPATRQRHPTKIYEYIAHRLPILINQKSPGTSLVLERGAGIAYSSFDEVTGLRQHMLSNRFYSSEPQGVYWEDHENLLIRFLAH